MIFMDFEASAGMGGFPIEVGFCIVNADKTMQAAAKLIRHDEWLDELQRWDWRAEQIHRIDRASLMEFGQSPKTVMRWLNDQLAGMVAFADSPMDKLWLDELAAVAGIVPAFGLEQIAGAFDGSEISAMAYEHGMDMKDTVCPKTHRADRDSENLATWYLLSLPHDAQVHRVFLAGAGTDRRALA